MTFLMISCLVLVAAAAGHAVGLRGQPRDMLRGDDGTLSASSLRDLCAHGDIIRSGDRFAPEGHISWGGHA